ncbi:Zinc finger, C2H2 type family protein [Trichomonas vaginalis G3]|uniref:Zinc finger, C2H2 type family protein n=1 Tax=Trichomonas vaginalis (strain ATCC PRA-98 / G3) TaxID=412133 RepID=A2EKF0_TRIV3|nr:zinc finger matrin-type protein 2 family [Trichomonas vaginalis G3]EAY06858.1 Zinc finger, C2H2 type family protein [Trichomonas vaginalis G3]KAI5489202.1 zinc finger matrin-type protein 2 family [Trichomonas vaginalis G3]|eukprot:XP_001319081.1 Zinc finger, C2H2 type family protein [Trichomonas vaginalis G3]
MSGEPNIKEKVIKGDIMYLTEVTRKNAMHTKEKIDYSKLKNLNVNLENIKLSKGINKRRIYGSNIPFTKIGQWVCPVCEIYFRDSALFLKHLNSPEHNAKLGMSLKVKQVSDEEVLQRVQQWEDFYIKGIPVPPIYREAKPEDDDASKLSEEVHFKFVPSFSEPNQAPQQPKVEPEPEKSSPKQENVKAEEEDAEEEYVYEYEYQYEEDQPE